MLAANIFSDERNEPRSVTRIMERAHIRPTITKGMVFNNHVRREVVIFFRLDDWSGFQDVVQRPAARAIIQGLRVET